MDHPRPEDKDWTWVLDRPCPDCGFDAGQIDRHRLAAQIRANAGTWRSLLGRGPLVSQRPPDGERGPIWSALEYACHVRDVYDLFGQRIRLMLTRDNPTFPNWDQDIAAQDASYRTQDPAHVSYELAVAAGKVADTLDRVRDNQWGRTGVRSDGQSFTVASIAAYLFHDVSHHLVDVERGLEALKPDEDDSDGGRGEGDNGN